MAIVDQVFCLREERKAGGRDSVSPDELCKQISHSFFVGLSVKVSPKLVWCDEFEVDTRRPGSLTGMDGNVVATATTFTGLW